MLRFKLTLLAVVCPIFTFAAAADSVIVFNPMQIESKSVESGLFHDLVAAELSCAEKIKLVDREQLDKILRERSLNPNGMLNADDASSIGSLFGADYFISGSVREKNGTLLIFVKSICVKSGVIKMKYISTPTNSETAAKKTAQAAVELATVRNEQKVTSKSEDRLLSPDKKRPAVAICIPEIHIASRRLIDPAAENELIQVFLKQKFSVKQLPEQLTIGRDGWADRIAGNRTTLLKAAEKSGADYLIYGEAISESSDTFGNYRTSRARVEIKVISVSSNQVIFAASAYAGAADTAEIISGKKAIQKAASQLALKAAEALLNLVE